MAVEDTDVQVARITARQAIVVAVITAVAGLAGGLVGRTSAPHEVAAAQLLTQHTLRILGVNYSLSVNDAIRIVVEVDGQAYSYPSRALWADIVPDMSSEEFPLPVGKTEYRVHRSAFLRQRNGMVTQASSQELQLIPVSALPIAREYALRALDAGFNRGSLLMNVRYEVR